MQVVVHNGMSLFDAPPGACLVHATNCLGVWGAGIASEMSKRFPDAQLVYDFACRSYGRSLLGQSLIIPEKSCSIGCLFTSFAYGKGKDQPDLIVEQTRTAVAHFLSHLPSGISIYSCQFNAGYFGVSWDRTEDVLLEADDPRVWNICKLA